MEILVINPGSTSTKIAIYQDENPIYTESISHTPADLAPFPGVLDQVFQGGVGSHGAGPLQVTAAVDRHPNQPGLFVFAVPKSAGMGQIAGKSVLHGVFGALPAL